MYRAYVIVFEHFNGNWEINATSCWSVNSATQILISDQYYTNLYGASLFPELVEGPTTQCESSNICSDVLVRGER